MKTKNNDLNETKKTNEQMHEELEQALNTVSEKLNQLIRNGSYTLDSISRDFDTNRVSWAFMWVGKHRLKLKADSQWDRNRGGTELNLTLPENPITQDVLDAWDRQTIDEDIAYHQRELEKLMKVKTDLEQK